jgi:hypothetical protein
MDGQPSVSTRPYDAATIAPFEYVSFLLPSRDYTTVVTNFPGVNCYTRWESKGDFFMSMRLYQAGQKVAELHSVHVNQDGCININLDQLTRFYDADLNGLVLTTYYKTKTIPVELYIAHTHKATGAYIAYPAANYMGDIIYTGVHAEQLENTLFWPGLVTAPHAQASVVVMNPYKLAFSYQVSLYLPDTQRVQTEVFKIKPYSVRNQSLEELFPDVYPTLLDSPGQCSLCVAAQYKVLSFMMIKDRASGIMTTIDHLHSYCLV